LQHVNIVHILSSGANRQPGYMSSSKAHARPPIAGVLGGMGPQATVDFMARVIAATTAATDQDHIHMIVDHNPQVPNRHAAVAGTAPSIGPELAAMARRLEGAGADFLVMVCNTAHAFADDIRAAVTIPFVSIIDVVMEALAGQPARRVGLMAAEGCLQARLYQQALERSGHEAVLWTNEELARFMDIIYRIKSGDRADDIASGLARLAAELEFRGADILVAGCTEVPMFLNHSDTTVPMLSSTDLLVRRTIELARPRHITESPI
jgi:aspartate racemase